MLHIDSIEAERLSRKKKKFAPNDGFSDFEQATIRQYKQLVKGIKPNMEAYEEAKEKLGPAFYGDRNTILHGLHKDKKESVDKMVADLEKQYVSLLMTMFDLLKDQYLLLSLSLLDFILVFLINFFIFTELLNEKNIVEGECTMMMLILIISTRGMPSSIKNLSDFMVNIQKKLNKIWNVVQQFKKAVL